MRYTRRYNDQTKKWEVVMDALANPYTKLLTHSRRQLFEIFE